MCVLLCANKRPIPLFEKYFTLNVNIFDETVKISQFFMTNSRKLTYGSLKNQICNFLLYVYRIHTYRNNSGMILYLTMAPGKGTVYPMKT